VSVGRLFRSASRRRSRRHQRYRRYPHQPPPAMQNCWPRFASTGFRPRPRC